MSVLPLPPDSSQNLLIQPTQLPVSPKSVQDLNSQQIKARSLPPNLQTTSFLGYSCVYSEAHAKREPSNHTEFLALELSDNDKYHVPTGIPFKRRENYLTAVDCDKYHLASSGLSLVRWRCKEGCDISRGDSMATGYTPLAWAAGRGHREVVEILLERNDIKPDKPNNQGLTPLWCAAGNGHDGVVKVLLGRGDVDPNTRALGGLTPLHWAAWNGHEGVVEVLLGRSDVNPNELSGDGRTPLWHAATAGQEGVVKMLLERGGVDPSQLESCPPSPFHRPSSSPLNLSP